MPVSYRIDPRSRIVFTDAHGALTDADVIAFQERLRNEPDFEPDFGQLADCREIEAVDMTTEGVEEAARRSPFSEGARRAIVVRSDLTFGMARMFEALRHEAPDEVHVFRDVADALRWLGVDGTPA